MLKLSVTFLRSWIMLLLIFSAWFYPLACLQGVSSQRLTWGNASKKFIRHVYTSHDYCVLTSKEPITQCKFHPTNKVEQFCSALTKVELLRNQRLLPQSMYQLPKPYLVNDTAAEALTKLKDLFIALNRTNQAIMLIGDSITRNSIEALRCILSIETGHLVEIHPPISKILWGATRYTVTLYDTVRKENVTITVIYFTVWGQYINGSGDMYRKEAKRLLKHDRSVDIVFVFNIGAHEKYEPTQKKHVIDIIKYARKHLLGLQNRSNLFLYRESSAQHFNSTAGYYNPKQAKKWKKNQLPLPTCVPYDTVANDMNDWRYNGEKGGFSCDKF